MIRASMKWLPVLLALVIAGCGGGSDQESLVDRVAESGEAREIALTGIDQMKFVVSQQGNGIQTGEQIGNEYVVQRITASPGETLRITLTTRSDLPAIAMAHNFVLLSIKTNAEQFARESVIASDNNYIAPSFEERIIAMTGMLSGGES